MSSAVHGATAPGKIMVSGEYAVLDGAPALVAAVQTRASAKWVVEPTDATANPTRFPEAHEARRLAEQSTAPVAGELAIDVSALRHGGTKLGLGSSAAAAAAAAAAVYFRDDVGHSAERMLDAALAGHHRISPHGSGADVAAAVLGGLVRFRRPSGIAKFDYDARTQAWPDHVVMRVVWTGQAARTSDFIRRVHALRDAEPEHYDRVMGSLHDRAAEFVNALNDAERLIAAAAAYGDAMEALGVAAGAPIVEARLKQIAVLAKGLGGSAKPSGAGGGDVALAFFSDFERAERFDAACAEAGFLVLDLAVGGPGVLPISPD